MLAENDKHGRYYMYFGIDKKSKNLKEDQTYLVNPLTTRDEKAEFANSVDLDEVAHNLHCLPSCL